MKEMPQLRFSAVGMLLAGLLLALPGPILKHAPKSDYFLYVGSKSKQGIFLYKFDPTAATLGAGTLATALPDVTSLAQHPGGKSYNANFGYGFGDLDKDGFNVFGFADFSKTAHIGGMQGRRIVYTIAHKPYYIARFFERQDDPVWGLDQRVKTLKLNDCEPKPRQHQQSHHRQRDT